MMLPEPILPMLASAGAVPVGPGWAFEWKWDGVRAVVGVGTEQVKALSRNGRDVTRSYPELAVLAELVDAPVIVDGELVSFDVDGRPDFGRLQSRMHVQAPSAALLRSVPVAFFAFDVLRYGDSDVVAEPYRRRREILAGLGLESAPTVRVPDDYVDIDGSELMRVAGEHGLEGIVAKRLDSRYHPGSRSRDWIKTPLRRTQEVVIGGWAHGEGRRAGTIGSLLLGVYVDSLLHYVGQVGTGFTEKALRDVQARLAPLVRETSPFGTEVPTADARDVIWVEPRWVGEVEYRQRTTGGRLRHPSWRGFRSDKEPSEVTWDSGTP